MKRIVLKVGSAVLTDNGHIARDRMQNLVDFIAELKSRYEVILVSSGAVAAGYTELKLDKSIIANRQALASIGQPLLMHKYKKKFEKFGVITSQILVTAANFKTEVECSLLRDTAEALLSNGVLPIVNENDATATQELIVGDNDQLSAYVAYNFGADLLVILSDIDAYYDSDPRKNADAKVRKIVYQIDKDELEIDVNPNNTFATGGIVTKLKAANFLLERSKEMFLTSGFNLSDARAFLMDNIHKGGTLFRSDLGV